MLSSQKQFGRNSFVELSRFAAAIIMAVYHFEWLYIGHPVYFQHFYILVEFFFVISGFFLAKKFSNAPVDSTAITTTESNGNNADAIRYTMGVFLKLWPTFFISFLLSLLANAVTAKMSLKEIAQTAVGAKWQIFLGQMLGIENNIPLVNRVAGAYESALLIAGLLLFWALATHKKSTVTLAPVIAISLYSFILYHCGSLSAWLQYLGFLNIGVLRALAGMLVGVLAHEYLLTFLRQYKTKTLSALLGICILLFFSMSFFQRHIRNSDMVFVVLLFALFLCLVYILDEQIHNGAMRRTFVLLGGISYEIYAVHYVACTLLAYYVPNLSYSKIIIPYILCTVLLAVITKFLTMPIHTLLNKMLKR